MKSVLGLIALTLLLVSCRTETSMQQTPPGEYTRGGNWSKWSVKLTSLNVWAVPVISKNTNERMPAIAEATKIYAPDVALFQEAWIKSSYNPIIQHAQFPYSDRFSAARTIGTGLLALSQFPIERRAFTEFLFASKLWKVWEGEALAGKGVGMNTITVRGLPISFFNTHLMARQGGDENLVDDKLPERLMQNFEIFRHIVEQTDSDAFILAGDFNSRYFHQEYLFFNLLTSLEANWVESASNSFCTSCESNTWKDKDSGQLDYIFVSPRLAFRSNTLAYAEPIRDADGKDMSLSDHYGWVSEVGVNPSRPKYSKLQVKLRTARAIAELHAALDLYKTQVPSGYRPFGVEDRICTSCRIEDSLDIVRKYEEALANPFSNDPEIKTLQMRLDRYFNFFR